MHRLIIIFSFLLTILSESFSQDPYYIRYGLEDGLPSEEVYDIEQDDQGKIWICTDRGVASYDGYEFTTYDVKDGLAHNTIFEIFKDNNGRIWFSGYDGSLTYRENNQFIVPKELNENLNEVFEGRWIKTMHQLDSFNFFITSSVSSTRDVRRNYIFNSRSNNFQKLFLGESKTDQPGFTSYPDYNVIIDKKNNQTIYQSIIESHDNYIYCLDRVTRRNSVSTMQGSLRQFSKFPSIIVAIKDGNTHYKKEIESQVEAIMKKEDKLFVCTWEGLNIYDFSTQDVKENSILKDYLITGIKLDREDNLWVSTQNHGVVFIPNLLRVNTFPIPINNANPTKLSVFKDHLFIGYRNGVYLQALNKELETVFSFKERKNIYYPYLTIVGDKAYTCNLTELVFDKEFKTNRQFGADISLVSRSTTALSDGSLIIGNSSLSRVKDGTLTTFLDSSSNSYVGYQCLNEKILLGTITGAKLIDDVFNTESKELRVNNVTSLSSRINDIKPYNDSLLVLASLGQGLIIYNCNSEKVVSSINQDLLSSQINTCFVDNQKNIWLGTNFGINILYTKKDINKIKIDSIKELTTSEGLYSNFILDIEEWNEEMWVVCEGGINHFSTENVISTSNQPYIHLDSITVSNKLISIKDEIKLDHDQNDLAIHYKGVTFKKPKNEKVYRYSLTKNDDEVSYQYTNNTNLQFTNLDPGSYSFEISARNNLDRWSKEPVAYDFTIKPHYSQTLWFKILAALLVFLLGYLIYKYREKQLIAKSKQIQDLQESELRTKIAELDALRNQMNPHFIYNSLNSIQNFIFKDDPQRANYLLARFSRLMRKSLEHSKLENISIEEEIDFLSNYLELESMRFEEKFNYSIKVQNNKLNDYEIPPLLVQPLIENAVKHGLRNVKNKGEIKILFEESNESIVISVRDNGSGYNPKPKDPSSKGPNAIDIINERVAIINTFVDGEASFEIKTLNENGTIIGTLAQLIIPIRQK